MVKKLQSVGFKNIKIEDASLRVAPSVLHVPFTIMGFFMKNIITLKGFKKESLHNLQGSFLCTIIWTTHEKFWVLHYNLY